MKALLVSALIGVLAATATAQNKAAPGSTDGATTGTTNPAKQKVSDVEMPDKRRFWQGNLPGGQYLVALDKITSVSRHSYVVAEAGLLIDEVVIDTVGQTVARFYFVSPVTEGVNNNAATNLTQRAKELLDYGGERAGTDVHKRVEKKFPEGLYAHTVEYRLSTATELGALLGSVSSAWQTGRGRIFTIK
ncbi:MAG: hypothetical protein K9N23_02110 [Akkermansiaceae bacterium]|nr:hypothetical protein [Akkermansiaceae bacterium]MCF7730445.1 hypothetical protein [Akkermansiaceae bacterium]